MNSIRRRSKSPTAFERVLTIVRLAAKGLVAQRVARKGVKTFKWLRRLPVLIGGAVVAYLGLKKLRGSGDGGGPEPWTQPPSAPPPSPVQTAGTGTSPPSTGPEAGGGPEVPPSEGDGAPAAAATTEAPDAADTIGDDLAAAAGGGADAESNGDATIPKLSESDERAPAPDEEPADRG